MDTIFWLLISAGTLCMIAWFILAVRQNIHANRKVDARDRGNSIIAAEETRAMGTLGTWMILLFVAALVFFGVNIVRIIVTGA